MSATRTSPHLRGAGHSNELWAITAVFNPCGFRSKFANYAVFRDSLCVPLAVVEVSYSGAFQLTRDDADLLIQLRAQDVMWHKERALMLGLDRLPAECRSVALLDADILFESPEWTQQIDADLTKRQGCISRTPPVPYRSVKAGSHGTSSPAPPSAITRST